MVEIKPFKGTRPFNEDAKSLIAPSTDHLSIENIEIFRKNNYWNYLKILNPVGQLKETDTLLEAKLHFSEMKENEVIKKDVKDHFYVYQIEFKEHIQTGFYIHFYKWKINNHLLTIINYLFFKQSNN